MTGIRVTTFPEIHIPGVMLLRLLQLASPHLLLLLLAALGHLQQ